MELAYKNKMGYYAIIKDGDEKHIQEAKYYVITKEEYAGFKQTERNLDNKNRELQKLMNEEIYRAQHRAAADVSNHEKRANERIKAAEEKAQNIEKDSKTRDAMFGNMYRISKEKANAERGIQNKKSHSGYLKISTEEIFERYKQGTETRDVRMFKTVIETPFSVDLALSNQMKDLAWEKGLSDIFEDCEEYANSFNVADAAEAQENRIQYLYKQNWRTGRRGFWEIVCFHTFPVKIDKIEKPEKKKEKKEKPEN